MKFFVECDSCNTLGRVSGLNLATGWNHIPRGWYQFTGPHPSLSAETSGTEPRDICGDCAVEIIRERMSASEWDPNQDSG